MSMEMMALACALLIFYFIGFLVGTRTNKISKNNEKPLYSKIKDGNVFACDVDDTLVMWGADPDDPKYTVATPITHGFEEKCVVNTFALEHLKKMKRRGYAIVVWSAGGSDWAEAVVKALDIEDYVDLVMPKIDDHLDDVRDPIDKIGRWATIDLEGNVQRAKYDGTVSSWKIKKGEDFNGIKDRD